MIRTGLRRRWSATAAGLAGLLALIVGLAVHAVGADQGKPDRSKAKGKGAATARVDELDALFQKAWHEAKIRPSAVASDAEYLRRAYLDLLGRIPNVQEASAFLDSKDRGKRAKLVEYLL